LFEEIFFSDIQLQTSVNNLSLNFTWQSFFCTLVNNPELFPTLVPTLKYLVIDFNFIQQSSWTDVMILKIYPPKKLAKILTFFARTAASFFQKFVGFFWKNAIFSENWSK
jgi:hypothetical protein